MMKKVALIADDSSTVRKFVAFALKTMNIECMAASDGMEALEMLPKADFDLVITDLNMPHLDGYELINSIRSNDKYEKIPIIILSSEADESDKMRGIELGADEYIVKTFNVEKLQEAVSKFLSPEVLTQ